MLSSVPDDIDKREGSIIWDALTPAAVELAEVYIQLDAILALAFVSTSNGKFLEHRTSELGINRNSPTATIRYAEFSIKVEIGERFFVDDLYFVVVESGFTAKIECETPGEIGNRPVTGAILLPVNHIGGLTSAVLGDIIIDGVDIEEDSKLKERYEQRVKSLAAGGNIADYIRWAKEVAAVGDAICIPLWNGRGTVKVVIVDRNGDPASTDLVQEVQNYIDPVPGEGEGKAPIGATVTVVAPTVIIINVSVTLTYISGNDPTTVMVDVETAIGDLIKGFKIGDNVRYAAIASTIYNVSGVDDYSNLLVNDGTANIAVAIDEKAVKGTVTLT
jgi:uncharacterized phage protein gp47/JayE